MSDPISDHHCPHCGSCIVPPGAMWHATNERRVVPVGEPFARIVGKVPAGGLFPRMESIDLRMIQDQRFETDRLWVRRWIEHEWRRE